ncbi:SDR family oxidoreductase [Rhodococcus oryzae]|uniref:SDR family oxidoreductase n=1 Tax=Rhodococcus oryzae TaxID=2571143 RepID=UPI0037156AE7
MTILVTGSRGAVAQRLIALLDARGLPYRAASSNPQDPSTIRCDLTDPADFAAALDGVTSVFLYAAAAQIEAFTAAATAAGVEHIVLLSSSSVLAPDAATDIMARSHLDVENALLASPIRTTLLRPGAFAGNAQAWALPIRSGSPVSLPYPGAHNDPIHEADVAEAALAVLTDPGLAGRAYTLSGAESVTFADQIEVLARVIGTPIAVDHVTGDAWKAEMADHVPADYADALLKWWRSNDGTPVELTDHVRVLTGHGPRSFTTWAQDHAAEFTVG